MEERIYLGAGSNLGDRLKNLAAARDRLPPAIRVLRSSPVYETNPWGYTDQPPFLNQVFEAQTTLEPLVLLLTLKSIEQQVGRKPTFHYGPRVVDLDILFYGDQTVETSQLVIPHPLIPQRLFVLAPLADLAPNLQHPVLKKTISELLAALPWEGIHLYASS